MGTFWKSHASDVYRLCYDRSFTNLFLGREVPIDAHYHAATRREGARLEIFCYSAVAIVEDGKRYAPQSKSSRLAIQEISEAGLDRAELKRRSIEERLAVHGVQFIHLWEARRDQVKEAYRDAFEVLLARLCDNMGAYTGFIFESDAKQEQVGNQIRPHEHVIVPQVVQQPQAQIIVPQQVPPEPPKPAGSS